MWILFFVSFIQGLQLLDNTLAPGDSACDTLPYDPDEALANLPEPAKEVTPKPKPAFTPEPLEVGSHTVKEVDGLGAAQAGLAGDKDLPPVAAPNPPVAPTVSSEPPKMNSPVDGKAEVTPVSAVEGKDEEADEVPKHDTEQTTQPPLDSTTQKGDEPLGTPNLASMPVSWHLFSRFDCSDWTLIIVFPLCLSS